MWDLGAERIFQCVCTQLFFDKIQNQDGTQRVWKSCPVRIHKDTPSKKRAKTSAMYSFCF